MLDGVQHPVATPWRSVAPTIASPVLCNRKKSRIIDMRYTRELDDEYKCARCKRRMTRKKFTYFATCLRRENS